jgi:TonB family protein
MKLPFVLILGILILLPVLSIPSNAQVGGAPSAPDATIAAAPATATRKLRPQEEAAVTFSLYYIKHTDALSEACAQQGISISSYTRRFIELHAPLLVIASKYVDLRELPDEAKIRMYEAARSMLASLAKRKDTDFSGACREVQLHGYEMAEHSTLANALPAVYRELTAEPAPPVPKDPNQEYIQRVSRLLRFHMRFEVPTDLQGNPSSAYQVELAPVGLVRDIKVIQASPLAGFDQAVINAIRAIEPFPKRYDGRVPPRITFTWRPKE